MHSSLNSLLNPKSIAVIGASRDTKSIGHSVFRNILLGEYKGVVYPVNPKANSLLGVKCYSSIFEIKDKIELAVILVPAKIVPAVVKECGEKGVLSLVIISAGFKEIGKEGAFLENEIREEGKKYNIRILGPNCLGIINTNPSIKLNSTFGVDMPKPGNISLISQSGAVCVSILDYAKSLNIGFSKIVSMGNKMDIDEVDLLQFLKDDPQTKVILMYVEDLNKGREFIEVARKITSDLKAPKPILAIKAGRTPEGAKAVSSHTGALAGTDEVYDAIFQQAGILRVDTISDLFAYALSFANQPLPKGRKVAIITNAGGPGIMATDACVRYGLEIAEVSKETKESLKGKLPPHASLANPIDLIADAREDRYDAALNALLKDKNVSSIIAMMAPQRMIDITKVADVIVKYAKKRKKTILSCFMGVEGVSPGIEILEKNNVPHYNFPEALARALSAMARYREWITRKRTDFVKFEVQKEKALKILRECPKGETGFIPMDSALSILECYGFPLVPYKIAKYKEECVEKASSIGFPVVLKVISPDIVHKFDQGLVLLNIKNEKELEQAWDKIIKRLNKKFSDFSFHGLIIQKMMEKGRETIIGFKRDKQFGAVLIFGLGGIYVEVLKDVTFRLSPIREASAYKMIENIKGWEILKGIRGERTSDIHSIAECLLRLSQFSLELEDISELDINPLIVYEKGKGAFVADVRIRVKTNCY